MIPSHLAIVHYRLNEVGQIGVVSCSKDTSFGKARLCRRSRPNSGLLRPAPSALDRADAFPSPAI